MNNRTIFRGAGTALITPTNADGVDYPRFGKLIDWQIEEGIDALIICGTTGESATLSDREHREVIAFAAERAAGRVPIIAGAGSNETSYSVEMAKHAKAAGADALLCVTPYYNKATQNGLIRSYFTIADATDLPIIVYNVPSRTGVNIEPKTYAELAKHENIVGIKEANGNLAKIVETMALLEGRLDLYSGNDDQIIPLMALGGVGVISVLSNVAPRATHELCARFLAGDLAGALELQLKYHALIDALFIEVNPIPVKAAMSAMGFCEDFLRLPLTNLEDAHRDVLLAEMRRQGLLA